MPTFVQASDTGVYTGNTTGIPSGTSSQILGSNTGIGHCVILMIQSLIDTADSVTAVTSSMGTFTRVNSYGYTGGGDAEDEIWVCLSTTGASKNVTVTCPSSNAWQAAALEFDTPAASAVDGGGGYAANDNPETITVSPGAAGNLVAIFQDSTNNFTDNLGSPWSIFASGVYFDTVTNGTSAAWQFAPSTSSLTASWPTGGGPSVTSATVLAFSSPVFQRPIIVGNVAVMAAAYQ